MNYISENKMSISAIVITILTFFAIGLYNYKNQFNLPIIFDLIDTKEGADTVKIIITSNLGTDYIVKMDLAIPYENNEQRDDIVRKMPRIQSDFLISIDQDDMERWISKGDYGALKAKLLEIVNRHSAKQVKILYFDSFNW